MENPGEIGRNSEWPAACSDCGYDTAARRGRFPLSGGNGRRPKGVGTVAPYTSAWQGVEISEDDPARGPGPTCAIAQVLPSIPAGAQCAPLQRPPGRIAAPGLLRTFRLRRNTILSQPSADSSFPKEPFFACGRDGGRRTGAGSHMCIRIVPRRGGPVWPPERNGLRVRDGGAPGPIPPVRGKWPKAKRGRDRRALHPSHGRGWKFRRMTRPGGPGPTCAIAQVLPSIPAGAQCAPLQCPHNRRAGARPRRPPWRGAETGRRAAQGGGPYTQGSIPAGAAALGRPPWRIAAAGRRDVRTGHVTPGSKAELCAKSSFGSFLSRKERPSGEDIPRGAQRPMSRRLSSWVKMPGMDSRSTGWEARMGTVSRSSSAT